MHQPRPRKRVDVTRLRSRSGDTRGPDMVIMERPRDSKHALCCCHYRSIGFVHLAIL